MKKTAKLALLVFLALLMGMLLLTACGGSRNGQQFPVGTTDENNEVVETIPVEENIYLSTDEGTAENKKVQSEIDLINDLCRSAYNAENAADLQDYIFGDINGDGKINMDDATKLMRYILKADPCLRHSWQEATCIEPKTCLECGVTEGEPNGHTEVIDAAVEPTCTETGLT